MMHTLGFDPEQFADTAWAPEKDGNTKSSAAGAQGNRFKTLPSTSEGPEQDPRCLL